MAKTLLLTRPAADSASFAARLPPGWQAHIAPMLHIEDLPAEPDFAAADALVFTSLNGVRRFAKRWTRRDLPAYCVGDATARAARDVGLTAHSAAGDIVSLNALLATLPAQSLLYLHGQHVSGTLNDARHSVTTYAIYNQRALPLDDVTLSKLSSGAFDAVALFSPRSAVLLAAARTDWPPLGCFCLSAAVAKPAAALGPCFIADHPSADSLLAVIGEFTGAQ